MPGALSNCSHAAPALNNSATETIRRGNTRCSTIVSCSLSRCRSRNRRSMAIRSSDSALHPPPHPTPPLLLPPRCNRRRGLYRAVSASVALRSPRRSLPVDSRHSTSCVRASRDHRYPSPVTDACPPPRDEHACDSRCALPYLCPSPPPPHSSPRAIIRFARPKSPAIPKARPTRAIPVSGSRKFRYESRRTIRSVLTWASPSPHRSVGRNLQNFFIILS
jgi:hypothetical protein